MPELKYTVIKSKEQYRRYCNLLEDLDFAGRDDEETENDIELLVALIKLWDLEHDKSRKLDPVQILKSFIADHKLKEAQVLQIMEIHSRGHLNDILNYKKSLSKKVTGKGRKAALFGFSYRGLSYGEAGVSFSPAPDGGIYQEPVLHWILYWRKSRRLSA